MQKEGAPLPPPLHGAADQEARTHTPQNDARACRLLQTTKESNKKWKDAGLVKRYFVSDGYKAASAGRTPARCGRHDAACAEPAPARDRLPACRARAQVEYFDKSPAKDKKVKPRGVYDMRGVEMLTGPGLSGWSPDDTAPAWAIEVHVEKHSFVLDFGFKGERDQWLRLVTRPLLRPAASRRIVSRSKRGGCCPLDVGSRLEQELGEAGWRAAALPGNGASAASSACSLPAASRALKPPKARGAACHAPGQPPGSN